MDDLDILQGAAVKIITSYPSGEVKSINKLDAESQSVVKNIGLKNWNTVCLDNEFLALEFKEEFKHEIGKRKEWQLFYGEQPRSVGSVFEQNALQGSGWKRTVCQVSNLSGTNSVEATERAAKAVVLAFSSLVPFRILKMSPASYSVDASKATIQSYESYSAQNYVRTMELFEVP